jgi:hypothetical protein
MARRYVNNDPNHPIHAPEQDEQIKQGIHTREESMIGRISPLKETQIPKINSPFALSEPFSLYPLAHPEILP